MSLTKATYSMILGEVVNVFDYMTPAQLADVQSNALTVDVTNAVQAAVTAAGVNGTIRFPVGSYLLSDTIECLVNQRLIGDGPNQTIFRRFTDYGNTIYFPQGGACQIKGIWFYHGTMKTASENALTNKATSGAHVFLEDFQGCFIEECWMWRMPYQIVLDGGSLAKITKCNIQGTWDSDFVAAQEGIAGISVGATTYSQIITVDKCYFGGSAGSSRTITWTASDGSSSYTGLVNAGNQYAINVAEVEDMIISNSYMGGNAISNIIIAPRSGAICQGIRIHNNFIDGAGPQYSNVNLTTQADGTYSSGVTISNNFITGQLICLHGIEITNNLGTQPACVDFTITGNAFNAFVGTLIPVNDGRSGAITGNSLCAYNARNTSAGSDLTYCAASYVTSTSSNITFGGNLVGGATNSAASPSYCYRGIYIDSTNTSNVVERGTMYIGGSLSGDVSSRVDKVVRVFTASGNVTMTGTEDVLLINKTVGGSTQIYPPTDDVHDGYVFTLKDAKGDAGTNPLQFIATVDGVVNPAYSTNYVTKTLMKYGAVWYVIGN
jgi:hypothetical protein